MTKRTKQTIMGTVIMGIASVFAAAPLAAEEPAVNVSLEPQQQTVKRGAEFEMLVVIQAVGSTWHCDGEPARSCTKDSDCFDGKQCGENFGDWSFVAKWHPFFFEFVKVETVPGYNFVDFEAPVNDCNGLVLFSAKKNPDSFPIATIEGIAVAKLTLRLKRDRCCGGSILLVCAFPASCFFNDFFLRDAFSIVENDVAGDGDPENLLLTSLSLKSCSITMSGDAPFDADIDGDGDVDLRDAAHLFIEMDKPLRSNSSGPG